MGGLGTKLIPDWAYEGFHTGFLQVNTTEEHVNGLHGRICFLECFTFDWGLFFTGFRTIDYTHTQTQTSLRSLELRSATALLFFCLGGCSLATSPQRLSHVTITRRTFCVTIDHTTDIS